MYVIGISLTIVQYIALVDESKFYEVIGNKVL